MYDELVAKLTALIKKREEITREIEQTNDELAAFKAKAATEIIENVTKKVKSNANAKE